MYKSLGTDVVGSVSAGEGAWIVGCGSGIYVVRESKSKEYPYLFDGYDCQKIGALNIDESINDPVISEFYKLFPCVAQSSFDIKKISDKKLELYNPVTQKNTYAYKVKENWYWENAVPIECD